MAELNYPVRDGVVEAYEGEPRWLLPSGGITIIIRIGAWVAESGAS